MHLHYWGSFSKPMSLWRSAVWWEAFVEGSFVSTICIYCLINIKGLLHFLRKGFNMTFCHWHSTWTININRRYKNVLHKFVTAKQQQSNMGLPVIFITFIKIKILYDKKTVHMSCCRILLWITAERNISICVSHFRFFFFIWKLCPVFWINVHQRRYLKLKTQFWCETASEDDLIQFRSRLLPVNTHSHWCDIISRAELLSHTYLPCKHLRNSSFILMITEHLLTWNVNPVKVLSRKRLTLLTVKFLKRQHLQSLWLSDHQISGSLATSSGLDQWSADTGGTLLHICTSDIPW